MNPINDILLGDDKGTDFLLPKNKAQSGFRKLNRFLVINLPAPFLLETEMFNVKEYQKIYGKRYRKSIHGKKMRQESNKKYRKSVKYITYQRNYKKSLKNRLSDKAYRESVGYKESQRRWCQSSRKKEYERLYWQTPKCKEQRKRYRESHKKEIRKSHRSWRQSIRGKLYKKAAQANRALLTKDLTIKIIQQVYENNIKRYRTLTCYLCLNPIEFGKDHLEHKIPLSRGGNNTKKNLDIACASCNISKGSKTVEEFKKRRTSE